MTGKINKNCTARIVACPVCRKSERYNPDNPYRPFCSERCRMIDLGQWLEEDYRIAGESAPVETDEQE